MCVKDKREHVYLCSYQLKCLCYSNLCVPWPDDEVLIPFPKREEMFFWFDLFRAIDMATVQSNMMKHLL